MNPKNNPSLRMFKNFRTPPPPGLHIEIGRYEIVPRDEQFLKCCSMSQIESECNFVLVPPLYRAKKRIFKPYF